jgi:hypothetical protein
VENWLLKFQEEVKLMKHLSFAVLALAVVMFSTGCAKQTQTSSNVPTGPVYTSASAPGLIPAGTQVVIRTNEPITSSTAKPNATYSGEVVRDIVNQNGTVLVPSASPVQLAVVEADSKGAGGKQLSLALRSITVKGKTYMVESPAVQQGREGLGANRRTAGFVGGGAILGTVIGAIAGGGTGAAIGAGVGAAGGAATQVITGGREVKVPAETVLTFRLDSPIELKGYSAK